MSQPYRLPHGGRVDRSRAVQFTFDGERLEGFHGDSLASALLANGRHFVARSFKYHRPRGILAAGVEEPNALVHHTGREGREDPNTCATRIALCAGLEVRSQNRWPSLRFDLLALNDVLAPLLPAGFYYKTFMWPRHAWRAVYEPLIRRAAGLGTAPRSADPDVYSCRYEHCDVLVVGAGPAGLAAARAALERGARVLLCDEQEEFGGSLLSLPRERIGERAAWDWLLTSVNELCGSSRIQCLCRTTAFGYYADNLVALVERLGDRGAIGAARLPRERLWYVRAREVVLATGAIERPLVFPDNDRPAIMLAEAARSFLNRYAVKVGDRLVFVCAHASGYAAALEVHERAGEVVCIIDPRPQGESGLGAAAEERGIEVLTNHTITETRGRTRISSLVVAPINDDKPARHGRRAIPCDALLMAGGWTPAVHLYSQARGGLRWHRDLGAYVPDGALATTHVAGALCGTLSSEACIAAGEQAGHAAAVAAECRRNRRGPATRIPEVREGSPPGAEAPQVMPGALQGRAFVDFQNDVCASDIQLAVREGFDSAELFKRYTTVGMATDQGKTSNLNAITLGAALLGRRPAQIGTTTFRAPYTPVSFGALAARHRGTQFDPIRTTALHESAAKAGAVFEPVGLWQRARYFPRAGEDMRAAVARECRATRERAGLFDASTLGKIEVVGPDAEDFLNRLYTGSWSTLQVGRCRYGLLLSEEGFVLDDGLICRLSHGRFHVTTTTSGAVRVLQHMEDYRQTEFSDLRVWLTSTTEEWAVIAVSGPCARQILEPWMEGIDVSPNAFPHMSVRECRICGVPARLFRVSFTGELGFEINVPCDAAAWVWARLQESGDRLGAVTYGTETMHVLRAEKGYIIIGQETDGTVTPDDVGLGWTIGKGKKDFIGSRSLARADLARSGRKQLVGLLPCDRTTVLVEGSQIAFAPTRCAPYPAQGHVTSSYWSATLARPFALALLADGRRRIGSRIFVPMAGTDVEAEVVSSVFYDPEGSRVHV